MTTRNFLQLVLPSEGNTYITVEKTSTGNMRHYTHDTLTEAQARLDQIINKRHDAYVATASFTGKKRTGKEVASKRAWYVDIDCKEGGQYATKREAIQALQKATAKGLPPYSMIIDSGNGYHIYWFAKQDVSEIEWRGVNKALINACKVCNLDIDVAVTQDIARMLRAPDSLNYKNPNQPVPCKIVIDKNTEYSYDQIRTAFEPYVHSLSLAVDNTSVDNSDLFGGVEHHTEGRKPLASELIPLCPVFTASIAEGGANDSEPLWHQLLYTLSFCEDGSQYAHSISDKHASYSHRETTYRYNRYRQDRDDPNNKFGPTTCEKFSTLSDKCASCEYKPKNLFKSPIKLGFGIPSELPWPFRNGEHGLEKLEDEDVGYRTVVRYKVSQLEALRDPLGDVYVTVTIGDQPITAPLGSFTDKTGQVTLANRGITLGDYEFREFKELMAAWIHQLNKSGSIKNVTGRQFGWNKDTAFIYDGMIYKEGERVAARGADPVLSSIYTTSGDIEPWRKCAQHVLDTHHPANWVILASAFAAPLIRFSGVASVVVSNVTSASGTSKSTRMQIAQAVWGNPLSGICSMDDTDNAIAHRMGTLNSLPAYWDEVREKEQAIKVIKLMFRVAQGNEKIRLTASIKQRLAGNWRTMLTLATNEPCRDHIDRNIDNSDAGVLRLFEIRNHPVTNDNLTNAEARRLFGAVHTNYGHAGKIYAEWLGDNPKEAERYMATVDDAITKAVNAKAEERFLIATISALLAGATLANKLGLVKFDLQRFKKYLIDEFLSQRQVNHETNATIRSSKATALLTEYVHHHAEQFIRADTPSRRGKPGNVLIDANKRPVLGRICQESNDLLVSRTSFVEWLYKRNGAGYTDVVNELTSLSGVFQIRSTLDGGSPLASGAKHYILAFNLNDPELEDIAGLAGADIEE